MSSVVYVKAICELSAWLCYLNASVIGQASRVNVNLWQRSCTQTLKITK